MFKTLRTAALTAVLALGSVAAFSAPASANGTVGIYLGFGTPVASDYRGGRHDRYDRRDRRDRHYRAVRACEPGLALHKARRSGIRHARLTDVGRRAVVVSGWERGHRERAVFRNVSGCPRIR